MHEDILRNVLRTLLVNGFDLLSLRKSSPDKTIINVKKNDSLGGEINYSLLLSTGEPNEQLLSSLEITASDLNSTPIVISDELRTAPFKMFTLSEFEDFFGGFVNTGLVLNDDLPNILVELGYNRLPKDFTGEPDELLEIYTKECLQFLLNSRARIYGNKRRGESLPDGVVIAGDETIILFDSKACKDGFEFESDDINRFAKYVNDFNIKYSEILGRVFCLLVVSSSFNDSIDSIRKRSNTLYTKSKTKLSCIKAYDLGRAVKEVRECQEYRNSIDWKEIFANDILTTDLITKQLEKIKKDKLL